MWKITWINFGPTKARMHTVCTPSATAATTLFGAMLGARICARLWTPDGHLFKGFAG